MLDKSKKLYYFIDTDRPTAEDINKAFKLAEKVEFISLITVDLNSPINEKIKYVAGKVPDIYSKLFIADKQPVEERQIIDKKKSHDSIDKNNV